MTWNDPKWLWALLLLPVFAAVLWAWGRSRKRTAATYADPALINLTLPRRVRVLRVVAAILAVLAAGAGIVAMARPAMSKETKENRSTVMLAIDTSKSMEKTDVQPSRLEAGVDAAERFLEAAPKDAAIGLVTFDAGARVRVAPTTDRGEVREALKDLPIGVGTAIGDAVESSLHSIQASGALANTPDDAQQSAARILLLTDGANSWGSDPMSAAQRAADLRVPVYSVLLGDDPGRTDQLSPQETLTALANQTGGIFTQSTSNEDLQRVYADIGASLASIHKLEEMSVWAVLAALVLLLLAGGTLALAEAAPRRTMVPSFTR